MLPTAKSLKFIQKESQIGCTIFDRSFEGCVEIRPKLALATERADFSAQIQIFLTRLLAHSEPAHFSNFSFDFRSSHHKKIDFVSNSSSQCCGLAPKSVFSFDLVFHITAAGINALFLFCHPLVFASLNVLFYNCPSLNQNFDLLDRRFDFVRFHFSGKKSENVVNRSLNELSKSTFRFRPAVFFSVKK